MHAKNNNIERKNRNHKWCLAEWAMRDFFSGGVLELEVMKVGYLKIDRVQETAAAITIIISVTTNQIEANNQRIKFNLQ